MQTAIQSANFNGQQLSIIDHDSRKWLTSEQIGQALGYSYDRARDSINTLYKRHDDEFSEADTCTINLMAQGQRRSTRIFSDTGCIKLGFFANTKLAKDFRTFASRELAAGRQERRPTIADFSQAEAITTASRLFLDTVKAMLPHQSLRRCYLMANQQTTVATGIDMLGIWKLSMDEIDDMPPMLPGRKLPKPEASGKNPLDKLARYLRSAKHLPVPKQASRFTAELIANLLGQGYIPRQTLLKVMHVPAAEFNLLIAEGKAAGIVRELDGIEFNYAGTLYVAGGAA